MNIKEFAKELSTLRPSSTFLSLIGYRNFYSEISDYSIVFHISYEAALKKSISYLESLNNLSSIEKMAKEELLNSFNNSLDKTNVSSFDLLSNSYSYVYDENDVPLKGIKIHDQTGILHLYGLVVHKRIIMPGLYPHRNRRELTVVKDQLRRQCSIGKFRQFRITPNQVERIAVENLSLLPPNYI